MSVRHVGVVVEQIKGSVFIMYFNIAVNYVTVMYVVNIVLIYILSNLFNFFTLLVSANMEHV